MDDPGMYGMLAPAISEYGKKAVEFIIDYYKNDPNPSFSGLWNRLKDTALNHLGLGNGGRRRGLMAEEPNYNPV